MEVNVEIQEWNVYAYEDGCYTSVDCKILATINGVQKTYHELENFKSVITSMKLSDTVIKTVKLIEEEVKKFNEEIQQERLFDDDDDW